MDPFIGQIIMFGGNFAPRGWALCNGQLLQISQHTALFSILGTTYGGDGRVTFGLPDLRGRAAVHAGQGPGLSNRALGSKSGTETNTLNAGNLPPLSIKCNKNLGTQASPEAHYPAQSTEDVQSYHTAHDAVMAADVTGGASQAVNNMSPYQVVNFIIALVGTFPSRN